MGVCRGPAQQVWQRKPVEAQSKLKLSTQTPNSNKLSKWKPVLDGSTRVFTEAELRQYDGRDGRPVFIAYNGIVYDVSDAPLWRTGMHQNMHFSGLDLTRSLRKAPHTSRVFERVYIRIVGVLTKG